MVSGLIFDLDNTLVECGQYYIDAQQSFVDEVHKATKADKTFIQRILEKIDVTSAELDDGFSPERFPRSFEAASLAIDIILGIKPDIIRSKRMYSYGNSVFTAPYPKYPGVDDMLEWYSQTGYKLLMVTKGVPAVQNRKIQINNLGRFFPPDHVYVTLKKSPQLLLKVIEEHKLDVKTSWMVGDSMRDDIGPAIDVGLNTVHVQNATGRWGYENQTHRADAIVTSVDHLYSTIPVLSKVRNAITSHPS